MAWWLIGGATVAMVTSVVITWLVRALARRLGWMTGPASGRDVHTDPLPRLGGVSLVIAFGFAIFVLLLAGPGLDPGLLLATAVPAAWMFGVGLIDDLRGVRAQQKLLAQAIAGITMFVLGLRFPLPGLLSDSGVVASSFSLLLTVCWCVAVTNALNLIDGLDGLASGASLSIVFAQLVMAIFVADASLALLLSLAVGAVSGFLFFNVHPASIFLGDSGSLVLGTLIAAFSIRLISGSPMGLLACLVLLAHPLGEIVISATRRFLRADPVFKPDRRHLHHRLLDRGLSHPHAAAVLVLASFLCSLLAVLVFFGGIIAMSALAIGTAGLALGFAEFRYREFKHFWNWVRGCPKQRGVIGAQMYLDELKRAIPAVRSLTELRILISESFVGCGCENARLRVRSYDAAPRFGAPGTSYALIALPLQNKTTRLGTLELGWDMKKGHWPFQVDYCTDELLPVLSRKLEQFVRPASETPRIVPVDVLRTTDLLPQVAAEADLRISLNS